MKSQRARRRIAPKCIQGENPTRSPMERKEFEQTPFQLYSHLSRTGIMYLQLSDFSFCDGRTNENPTVFHSANDLFSYTVCRTYILVYLYFPFHDYSSFFINGPQLLLGYKKTAFTVSWQQLWLILHRLDFSLWQFCIPFVLSIFNYTFFKLMAYHTWRLFLR